MSGYLIYGANGYSGELITRLAVERGHRPVLAGRNASAVGALANRFGLPARVFGLDNPDQVAANLVESGIVLNCAGPFSRTAKVLAEGCLRQGSHYLDITGEIGVFEMLARLDEQAKSAGVMLLPGVGFDVVPSDCLALHLKELLPTATRLNLGFQVFGGLSRGTATTMLENLHRGGMIRRAGVLTPVPACWRTRPIDFAGLGTSSTAMTIPWGDVSTAWYTTGIPNIEVYTAASPGQRMLARLARSFGWLLGSRPVQNWLKKRIQARPAGPSDEQRAGGRSLLWGEALDEQGGKAVSRLRGLDGYTMTALTAVAIVERVARGESKPGFQTPAGRYGADFILGIPGVERKDGPIRSGFDWQRGAGASRMTVESR
jgi:short subunit dehydrogenase-like uncharacterized protein